MSGSLRTHGALTEASGSESLTTPIGKGREEEIGREGEVGHPAIPPYDAPAPQCDDEPCPRCSELEKQLAGARLALAVVKDALAAERGGQ